MARIWNSVPPMHEKHLQKPNTVQSSKQDCIVITYSGRKMERKKRTIKEKSTADGWMKHFAYTAI
jgi:hypothetical protein